MWHVCSVHCRAHTAFLHHPDELTAVDPMEPSPQQLPTSPARVPPSAVPHETTRPHTPSSPQPAPSSQTVAGMGRRGRRRRDGVGMGLGLSGDGAWLEIGKEEGWKGLG